MVLSKGENWGIPGILPIDAPLINSDRELAKRVNSESTDPASVVALAGGDICRTLGGRGDVATRLGQAATLAPIDAAHVVLDGNPMGYFVAHLLARTLTWNGRSLAIMNAEWMGPWQLSPRAHPGDGLLDVLTGCLSFRETFIAAKKARTGSHLPHPQLSLARRNMASYSFDKPRRVYLDGTFYGRFSTVQVSLVPSAIFLAV